MLVQAHAPDRRYEDEDRRLEMLLLTTTKLTRTVAKKAVVLALSVPVLLPGLAYADSPTPPNVPTTIKVPAGNVPFLLGHATGTQNYACQLGTTGGGYAWTFVAPSATLPDDKGKGKEIMTHFAGPTWQTTSGSTVKAAGDASVPSRTGSIDWLRLRATSTTPGQLIGTTYIQRVITTGGLPPSASCTHANEDQVIKVPYTADYYFYKAS
jgi:hypothetical protein